MRSITKNTLGAILLLLNIQAAAQRNISDTGAVEPYYMEVTYHKTSHLLFPSPIRYVDLGSDYLIAGKAEDAENVLRIKAAVQDFTEETNFSVITEDGRFYNFNVHYSPMPATLNFDIQAMEQQRQTGIPDYGNGVLFDELGSDSPQLTDRLLEAIYNSNKTNIRHIASAGGGILCMLTALYVHDGRFYLQIELRNRSNIPFSVEDISFGIVDKKVLKRSAVQEKPLSPLRVYHPFYEIAGKSAEKAVFLLDRFVPAKDKILQISIYEKKGGRHQILKAGHSVIIHARTVKDLQPGIY